MDTIIYNQFIFKVSSTWEVSLFRSLWTVVCVARISDHLDEQLHLKHPLEEAQKRFKERGLTALGCSKSSLIFTPW